MNLCFLQNQINLQNLIKAKKKTFRFAKNKFKIHCQIIQIVTV